MAGIKISQKDLYIFFRELSRIVKGNLPIDESLKEIKKNATASIGNLAERVEMNLRKGMRLSSAVEEASDVNPYAITLLRAGEESGALLENLNDILRFYNRSIITRKTIAESIRYPAIILFLFIIISLGLAFFVIPQFRSIFNQFGLWRLPRSTQIVLLSYEFLRVNVIPVLIVVVVVVISYAFFRRTQRGKVLEINLLLMTPVVGRAIYLDALGRFCRAIGVLLKRKVDIQKALILAASSVESLLGKKMAGSISSQLAKGKKFSEGMDASGLFSRSFVWMVEKAEARGDLEDTLIEIAGYYDENFEYYRHAFILLEPFLIVIVGIFIGFIVVSMYTPLFMLPKLIR